jgi:hypothetical protein
MVTSSLILLALSVGLPGTLTGIAVIVAVFRAEKGSLADIIRAAVRAPSASPAELRTLESRRHAPKSADESGVPQTPKPARPPKAGPPRRTNSPGNFPVG